MIEHDAEALKVTGLTEMLPVPGTVTLGVTFVVPVQVVVVYPAAEDVVDGSDHAEGTFTTSAPVDVPPVTAVYVKVRLLPVDEVVTVVGETAIVPDPFADTTSIDGTEDMVVSGPVEVELSVVANEAVPVDDGTVTPVTPPPVP